MDDTPQYTRVIVGEDLKSGSTAVIRDGIATHAWPDHMNPAWPDRRAIVQRHALKKGEQAIEVRWLGIGFLCHADHPYIFIEEDQGSGLKAS